MGIALPIFGAIRYAPSDFRDARIVSTCPEFNVIVVRRPTSGFTCRRVEYSERSECTVYRLSGASTCCPALLAPDYRGLPEGRLKVRRSPSKFRDRVSNARRSSGRSISSDTSTSRSRAIPRIRARNSSRRTTCGRSKHFASALPLTMRYTPSCESEHMTLPPGGSRHLQTWLAVAEAGVISRATLFVDVRSDVRVSWVPAKDQPRTATQSAALCAFDRTDAWLRNTDGHLCGYANFQLIRQELDEPSRRQRLQAPRCQFPVQKLGLAPFVLCD
jgi:hypothetical protein